jgi:hypothetical protein
MLVHNTISKKTFQILKEKSSFYSVVGYLARGLNTFANNRRIQKLKKEISGFVDLLLFYGCIITLNYKPAEVYGLKVRTTHRKPLRI